MQEWFNFIYAGNALGPDAVLHGSATPDSGAAPSPPDCVKRRAAIFVNYVYIIKIAL